MMNDLSTEGKGRIHQAPPFDTMKGMQFYAKDSDGQWYYVNHASTWQTMPPLAAAPPPPANIGADSPSAREVARPLDDWYEELGDVLWWLFNEDGLPAEAPWVGSPLNLGHAVELHASQGPYKDSLLFRGNVGGWPGYHTHWTPLPASPVPALLLATSAKGGSDG